MFEVVETRPIRPSPGTTKRATDAFNLVLGHSNGDPPLYVGGSGFMMDPSVLGLVRIKSIVSCLPWEPEGMSDVLQEIGVQRHDYMVYPLEDSRDCFVSLFQSPDVLTAVDFIHARRLANKSVFVHCDGGITRSPTVCVAYIMKYGTDMLSPRSTTFQDACNIVRSARDRMDVCLFSDELRTYEWELGRLPSPYHSVLSWSSPPHLSRFATADLRTQFGQLLEEHGGHAGLADAFHAVWLEHGIPKRFDDSPASETETLAMEVIMQLSRTLMHGISEISLLNQFIIGGPFVATSSLRPVICENRFESFSRAIMSIFQSVYGDTSGSRAEYWRHFVTALKFHWNASNSDSLAVLTEWGSHSYSARTSVSGPPQELYPDQSFDSGPSKLKQSTSTEAYVSPQGSFQFSDVIIKRKKKAVVEVT